VISRVSTPSATNSPENAADGAQWEYNSSVPGWDCSYGIVPSEATITASFFRTPEPGDSQDTIYVGFKINASEMQLGPGCDNEMYFRHAL